jgi:hypothetical protein
MSLPRACLRPCGLANRPQPDWQGRAALIPRRGAESMPLPRARVSTSFVRGQMTRGRSRSRIFCRAPARALRHRLCAGFAALARTLGCSDRTRRDRDRLGAGDSAASLLRAGGSASAPYRRARPAAFIGGGTVGVARRSPTAAASVCQEGA